MQNFIGRRLTGVLALFLAVGLVGCAGKVDQETFDQEISDLRSTLDDHDSQISDNASSIEDLEGRVSDLESDLQDLRNNFQARISELEEGLRFTMPVHFEFDESQIRSVDRPLLDRFASVVTEHYSGATLTVEGFADPAGSDAYNDQLSLERARAVKQYLVDNGDLNGDRIRTVGYGEADDRLVSQEQGPGQQGLENRRVTFVVEWGGQGQGG
jgi:peptidoglycan-associated lipoprotein